MEIHPRVTAIQTNKMGGNLAFLIRGPQNTIIDTGSKGSPEEYIAPALKELGMTLADIDLILNTHGHFDHTGGNAAIKSASNAKIFIHADDVIDYLEKPELSYDRHIAPIVEVVLGKEHLDEEKKRFFEMNPPNPPMVPDRLIKDNEIIELGDGCDLKVLHLPGHTPGCVGFLWEKEGIFFAGDVMTGIHGPDFGLPIVEDLAAYEKSVERVKTLLPLKVIALTHPHPSLSSPPSQIRRDEDITEFVESSWELIQRLKEAIKSVAPSFGKKPFGELYDEVVSRFPKEWELKPYDQLDMFFSFIGLINGIKQLKG